MMLYNFECAVHFMKRDIIADFRRTMPLTREYLRTQVTSTFVVEKRWGDAEIQEERNFQIMKTVGMASNEGRCKREDWSEKHIDEAPGQHVR